MDKQGGHAQHRELQPLPYNVQLSKSCQNTGSLHPIHLKLMLQTYAAIRKRKRDLLRYVKGSAQRRGERQLRSSLPCGHRAMEEGAWVARPSGSQCR